MRKNFLLLAIFVPAILLAQKNAQWRGENRDGVYNETGLLKQWPAGGPQLMWSYTGMGNSFASVAIANAKIYLTGLEDDNLFLYVLDMSGKLITKKLIGKEWTTNHTGTRCTVVVNDGKLYIGNSLGQLFCLDEATLNEVWKKDMLNDFDGKNIMWGMVESPLIVGEKIFLTPGGTTHNMVALNKNTGALIWSSKGLGTTSSYCSPVYIGDQSIPMVITATLQDIVAFNANTGEVVWSHPQANQRNIHPNSPIYRDGMVFCITGYRGGAMLLRLKDGGKAVEQVWKNPEMDNQMGGAIKAGDYVYASGHNHQFFFCVDWNTGETKYKEPQIGQTNVILADGMLYVYSDTGTMYLVKPNPDKFDVVSRFEVTLGTREHWTHPVIHNGILYLRHGDTLMAYKIK
ncbi:MAG: PQQ-binding-like beta-propeller repeat protein [Tannerella sp.]|nr:PQQ-binding-like beta-propeller repeat protein [Tannerella sp.]